MNAAARHVIRIAAVALVGAAVVIAQAGPASAAETNGWGTFAVSGSGRAYTGTVTLPGGFPKTTFTSTSRQATVVSGASVWQAASTPVGAVYGTSQGKQYLNQRPNADNPTSPAVTTYSFGTPTPASGWSFVLGDIDADQATVSATDQAGQAVPVSALGFQGVYNYCHRAGGPSCDSANLNDVPSWNATTGVLTGNIGARDTEGASGWFSPSVPLASLTITYQQRSGLPVYQTWFATKTFAASGAVRVNGQPYGDAALTITDASGAVVATTTSAGDGTWSVPGLVSTSGYHVSVSTPPGAVEAPPLVFDTLDADTPGLDFGFTITPVTITSTVTDSSGQPAADEPLVITRDGDDAPTATVTTDADGAFTADLLPSQTYSAVLDGAADQPITLKTPAVSGAIAPLVQPQAPGSTPPVTTPAPPVTSTPVPVVSATQPELAFTGSEATWPVLGGGAALAILGTLMILFSRRTSRGTSGTTRKGDRA